MALTTLKVLTIVGTRPELIRLSRVIAALDQSCDHVLVHTGQNHDPQLSEVFFADLGIRAPNYYLSSDGTTLGRFLGSLFTSVEEIIAAERPDALLVLGDTNSALAAIIASRAGVVVFHMEAGNRSFDINVPEETNRRIVDHFADINLVYTEHARRNLMAEGLHPRTVYLTGSPLYEVLEHARDKIAASTTVADLGLTRGGYFVLSMHRQENVDDPGRLDALLEQVADVGAVHGMPVLVSAHPRLRKQLERGGTGQAGLTMHPPFSFTDYIALQTAARCVISDSGTISEEAAILGFPAVTIRDSIERPEAMDGGSIILAGIAPHALRNSVALALANHASSGAPPPPPEYAIANCSERVVNLIVGLAPLTKVWNGRRDLPPR